MLGAWGERCGFPLTLRGTLLGRYALSLTPVQQGRNTTHVCWAGMNVKGSPFAMKALPAPPHAASYKPTLKPKNWPTLVAGAKFKLRFVSSC